MIWLIPIGLGAAALAHSMWTQNQRVQPGNVRNVGLETALPTPSVNVIIAAIMSAKDPSQLDSLAAQYRGYPFAAYELEYRAWELRGRHGPPPKAPKPVLPAPVSPAPAAPPAPTMSGAAPAMDLASAAIAAAMAPTGAGPTTPAPAPAMETPDVPLVTTYGAGSGWTLVPSAKGFTYSAPMDMKDVPGDVIIEASRIAQAEIKPGEAQLEQLSTEGIFNGSYWLFINANGGLAVFRATPPATQQTGYVDPMGGKPPFTTEYREEAAGVPVEDDEGSIEGVGAVVAAAAGEQTGSLVPDISGSVPGSPIVELTGGSPDISGGVPDISGGMPDISGAAPTPTNGRPRGSYYIRMRSTDRIWPRRIAEIGAGIDRGSPAAVEYLTDLNPHLAAPGGRTIRETHAGDEINIPPSWAKKLQAKGFDVRHDG